jgi:hypothetical protein
MAGLDPAYKTIKKEEEELLRLGKAWATVLPGPFSLG